MKNITLLLAFFILFSVQKTAAQEGPKVTKEPTVYKGVTDKACAVEVAFGSYGAGIDAASFEKIQALIKSKNLASTSQSIGREGEQRICLPLNELKKKDKNKIIDQLKKIAKSGQLVSVSIR